MRVRIRQLHLTEMPQKDPKRKCKAMRTIRIGIWLPMLLTLSAILVAAVAEATPLAPNPDNPALELNGPGLTLSVGGVGLDNLGSGTRTISVDIGGPVEKAILYWGGRHRDCSLDEPACDIASVQPYRDQELIFDGMPILGNIIGTELQPATSFGPQINVGYSFDVTGKVQSSFAGANTYVFDIQDGDTNNNLVSLL